MTRRRILYRQSAAQVRAVTDEAPLRSPGRHRSDARAQLRHLLDIYRLPQVTVQILPFHTGGHAAEGGPVTILGPAGGPLADVVYLGQLATALYSDRPTGTERYADAMNRLVVEAESPEETPTILHRVIQET